jgi:hypothetical protein
MFDTDVPPSHTVEDLREEVLGLQKALHRLGARFDERVRADQAVEDKDVGHRRKWFP